MVQLCHVSIWQPTQCTLQSAVVPKGLHLVLEIPRTQSSCCWHSLIERSGLHHWTTHFEENLDFLQSWFPNTGTSQHVLPCHFVGDFVWSGFCMGTPEGHSSRFCERMNEKDPILESVSGVTFLDFAQRNLSMCRHSLGILQSTFYHLLISVLLWWTLQCSCVFELLYPASNLELMGKVIEIKPYTASRLDSLQWFRLQIEGHTIFFFPIDHAISWSNEMLFYFLSTLKNTE